MIVTAKNEDGAVVFEQRGVDSFEYDSEMDWFVIGNSVTIFRDRVASLKVDRVEGVVN